MGFAEQLIEYNIDLTEEQLIAAIKRVASLYARDFTFGIYAEEDIIQECYIIALKELHRFDHEKSSGSATIDKVERFLYVMLLSRIKNLKRDKFCKTNSPCQDCYKGEPCTGTDKFCKKHQEWKDSNDSKMSIMNPWSLNAENDTCDHDQNVILPCLKTESSFNGVDISDLISVIRPQLTEDMRELFDKLCCGEKIGYAKKAALLEQIHEIIGE